MTTPLTTSAARPARQKRPFAWRQVATLARLEIRQGLFRGRSVGFWLLALLPVALTALASVFIALDNDWPSVADVTETVAFLFRGLILMLVVFFGCLIVFGGSVRREILERTLHYLYLMPMTRRELLVGKYLGAWIGTASLLALSSLVTFALAYVPAGAPALGFVLGGPGLGHLVIYLLVVILAVAGYGAVFLAFGLFFKKPAIPGIVFFGWEMANFLLPPGLKRISVIHYLKSLTPVPVDEGPLAVVADAPGPLAAVVGLLLFIAAVLVLASWKLSRTEISYGED